MSETRTHTCEVLDWQHTVIGKVQVSHPTTTRYFDTLGESLRKAKTIYGERAVSTREIYDDDDS